MPASLQVKTHSLSFRKKCRKNFLFSKISISSMSSFRIVYIAVILIQLLSRIDAKSKDKYEVTHYFVFGDKFSGVEFTSKLLNSAIPSLPLQECKVKPNVSNDFRHSTFSWRDAKKSLECNVDSTLFLLVTKDPYSWLTSVGRRLFTNPKGNDVIRSQIQLLILQRQNRNKLRVSSTNAKVFVLKERTKTLRSHLAIISRARYSAVLRYEDLLENPDFFVKKGMRVNSSDSVGGFYIPRLHLDDHKRNYYLNKTYISQLTNRGVEKSLLHLDKRIESKLGYRVPPSDNYSSLRDDMIKFHRESNLWMYLFHVIMDVIFWIVVTTVTIMLFMLLIILRKKWVHSIQKIPASKSVHSSYSPKTKKA